MNIGPNMVPRLFGANVVSPVRLAIAFSSPAEIDSKVIFAVAHTVNALFLLLAQIKKLSEKASQSAGGGGGCGGGKKRTYQGNEVAINNLRGLSGGLRQIYVSKATTEVEA